MNQSLLPQAKGKDFRYWRMRVMYSMIGGYALFYFVRKNMSLATKPIMDEFHFSNTEWGWVLSVSTIVYALSKFLSGIAADRFNARWMMSLGLFGSAVINLFYGFGSTYSVLLFLWALNQVFQGMGMPPCSRLLTRWYRPNELGRAWGIWNASHQMGGAVIMVLAAYLIEHYGWRSAFWVPGAIAFLGSLWLVNRLVDSPESLGFSAIEEKADKAQVPETEPEESFWHIFRTHILGNVWVWLFSIANFFIYYVRTGVMDWAPKYLQEVHAFTLPESGFAVSGFEVAGIFGAIIAGWLSDVLFPGRRGPILIIFTVGLFATLGLLYESDAHPAIYGLFWTMGFLLYGPQMLIAVAAAEFASKKAASSAVGLTGLTGYIGASVCSAATGYLLDHSGWDAVLISFIGAIGIAVFMLLFSWKKSALPSETTSK